MANMAISGLRQAAPTKAPEKPKAPQAEQAQAEPAFAGSKGGQSGGQGDGKVTLTQQKYEKLVKAASAAPGGFDSSAP